MPAWKWLDVRFWMFSMWYFPDQTAEIILRNNSHCSATEMILEPLLRERVRFLMYSSLSDLKCGPLCSPFSPCCCYLFQMQSFGVFEGRAKHDFKNAANACGQSCRDFTPPGGETPSEVSQTRLERQRENAGKERLRVLFVQQHRSVDTYVLYSALNFFFFFFLIGL